MRPKISAEKFKNDLLWAVSSPSIMQLQAPHRSLPQSIQEQVLGWLQEHEPRAPRADDISPRLGLYFEFLWKYIFEHFPGFRLVAHNLQVFRKKQTLGAFDFIYFCIARGGYFHMETAVKFYLGVPDPSGDTSAQHLWIGPGQQDRLDIKFEKMLHLQSQLSSTPEGKAALAALGIHTISSELILKGRLFYPHQKAAEPPTQSTANHNRGCWISHRNIDTLPRNSEWQVLNRSEWLTTDIPDTGKVIQHAALHDTLFTAFADHPFPLMLKRLANRSAENLPASYYFMVPGDWLSRIKTLYNPECGSELAN